MSSLYSLHNIEEALCHAVEKRLETGETVLLGIDGPCAAGKTTLAGALAEKFGGNVFHMDDFFLPPEKKTPARLSTPGGNVHYERVLREILQPIRAGKPAVYRKYDCRAGRLLPAVCAPPARLSIIEGSYSLHPALRAFYTLKVFLPLSAKEQLLRLSRRESEEKVKRFQEEWIPLENLYFEKCAVAACADLVLPQQEGQL